MLNHKGTQMIHTDRLVLRRYSLSDSKDMFQNYANDERVTKYLSWNVYEKEEDIYPFLEMSVELAAVIRFLFEEVGMHRIMAKHDMENPASGEVMKKCGMTYEGKLKEILFAS